MRMLDDQMQGIEDALKAGGLPSSGNSSENENVNNSSQNVLGILDYTPGYYDGLTAIRINAAMQPGYILTCFDSWFGSSLGYVSFGHAEIVTSININGWKYSASSWANTNSNGIQYSGNSFIRKDAAKTYASWRGKNCALGYVLTRNAYGQAFYSTLQHQTSANNAQSAWMQDKPYFIGGSPWDISSTYCSEFVWRAWASQQTLTTWYNLQAQVAVSPKMIRDSPYIVWFTSW